MEHDGHRVFANKIFIIGNEVNVDREFTEKREQINPFVNSIKDCEPTFETQFHFFQVGKRLEWLEFFSKRLVS